MTKYSGILEWILELKKDISGKMGETRTMLVVNSIELR